MTRADKELAFVYVVILVLTLIVAYYVGRPLHKWWYS